MIVLAGLGVGLLVAMPLSAERQCVPGFSACATLVSANFSGSTLVIQVTNTSNNVENPGAFLGSLYLEFEGDAPGLASNYATVLYGSGMTEQWRVGAAKGQVGGFGHDWDLQISDNAPGSKGGNSSLRLGPWETATIQVEFTDHVDQLALGGEHGFTAHMQGLGLDGEGSGFTVTPEPVSVVLFGSGLFGIGGVGMRRRRRKIAPEVAQT
jgi:hypothetical protein